MSVNKKLPKEKVTRKDFLTTFEILCKENNYEEDVDLDDDNDSEILINQQQNDFQKIYMFGEKGSGFRLIGSPQNYSELLQYHLQAGSLFEDTSFAPDNIALVDTGIGGKVVWKRPHEIVENPQFIVDGISRFDVDQGNLGDCWFLASIATLTTKRRLLEYVVPTDQSFKENYAGIFHFRFWQFGRWVDVVIDDRLPTINGELIFLKSAEPKEFWTPLLEKAYAKIYGSYQNIDGGQISEALEDMTGGLSEFYETKQCHISRIMLMSYERSSFMGCSIMSSEMEGQRPDGLVTMHAYSITKMTSLNIDNAETNLVRLRNPWGNEIEWNGAWSDNSEHWYSIPKETRDSLLQKDYDGEFWMDLRDFQERFTFLDICHLNPSSFAYLNDVDKKWSVSMFEGTWVPNVTAGGGLRYIDSFANNPQYFLRIKGSDDRSKEYAVVIGLMQKNRRVLGLSNLPTEIIIFRLPKLSKDVKLLNRDFFESNQALCSLRNTTGTRQLTGRFHLPVGRYCIIPCTSHPNLSGEYLLRVFCEVDTNMRENDEEIGYQSLDDEQKQQAIRKISTTYQKMFRNIADGETEIGWDKIRKVLNKVYAKEAMLCFLKPKKTFSKETCRNIIALWDKNYSGTLDYDEFWKLMTDVTTLELIFKRFDQDNSGKLNGFELRNLLDNCGYKVNRKILNIIMLRYGVDGSLTFENFVMCSMKLRAMIEEFNKKTTADDDNNEGISLSKAEWLEKTIYA